MEPNKKNKNKPLKQTTGRKYPYSISKEASNQNITVERSKSVTFQKQQMQTTNKSVTPHRNEIEVILAF